MIRRLFIMVMMLIVVIRINAAFSQVSSPSQSTSPAVIDTARSLIVTDRDILESFTLEKVFGHLVGSTSSFRFPLSSMIVLWRQFWDTQAERTPGSTDFHCDDEMQNGQPVINGFPIICPRRESREALENPFPAGDPKLYRATALINRFDLAPLSGANCGEYRIIFARIGGFGGRNFVIFEAVLPNPKPAIGLEGCRPVAEFWAGLSNIKSTSERARKLQAFYFTGLPYFSPVVHVDNYGRLGGQVRTNQFMESPWLLREFKLIKRCHMLGFSRKCDIRFLPVTVKNNPFGELFGNGSASRKNAAFQIGFTRRMRGLLVDDIMKMSLPNDDRFNPGESHSQDFVGDYVSVFQNGDGNFAKAIQTVLHGLRSDLEPIHVVRRAMFLSCGGCHQHSTFFPNSDLGHGISAPQTLGFVHVDEQGTISPAMRNTFLPHRKMVLEKFLQHGVPHIQGVVTNDINIGGPEKTH